MRATKAFSRENLGLLSCLLGRKRDRNLEIIRAYRSGVGVGQIAQAHGISERTVASVVYTAEKMRRTFQQMLAVLGRPPTPSELGECYMAPTKYFAERVVPILEALGLPVVREEA